jgi:molybdopterin adenylyltransferase
MSSSPGDHRAEGAGAASFGLLTVSDSRSAAEDVSGRTMRALVESAGHTVRGTAIVADEPREVVERVLGWVADEACDVVVTSGGTGLSARDRTVEAVSGLFDLSIAGFGELFRVLSYAEIGPAAMLTRAEAGVVRGTPVFLLPGSPKAVSLAMERLVLPEIGHLLRELRRQGPRS